MCEYDVSIIYHRTLGRPNEATLVAFSVFWFLAFLFSVRLVGFLNVEWQAVISVVASTFNLVARELQCAMGRMRNVRESESECECVSVSVSA